MPKFRFAFTVILVAFLVFSAASGQTATTQANDAETFQVIERHNRRVLTDVQDYDYGGSNPKHDPRRKPGNGH